MTSSADWKFDEKNADIGFIYLNRPVPEHLCWIKLFSSMLFPVCSPALVQNYNRPLYPQDLCDLPLITVYTEDWNWHHWFDKTIPDGPEISSFLEVDTLAIALEMAEKGEGVALVNGPAAHDEIGKGNLICPVNHNVDFEGDWGLIYPMEMQDDNRIIGFIDWLKTQI